MSDLFTDIDKAVEVIGNRRADSALITKVNDLLGNDIPGFLTDTAQVPICFAPHVAGGTNAERQFAEEAEQSAGTSIWTSYVEDMFTTRNASKVNSWRPRIAWDQGQQTRQWLVDAVYRQGGTSMGNTISVYGLGEDFLTVAQCQANLARAAFKCADLDMKPVVYDYSAWYARQSTLRGTERMATSYYPAVMAIYSTLGVLYRYEGKDGDDDLAEFRATVAGPAADLVNDELGVRPVILARPYPSGGEVTDLTQFKASQLQPIITGDGV